MSDYMSANCHLGLDNSKPIFWHNTLAHCDASPYQIWWQRVDGFRRYLDKHSLTFWTFTVTLTLNALVIFFSSFSQDIQASDDVPLNQVWLSAVERHISPCCDFEPEDNKPIFLHNILANVDASSYQVWLQRFGSLEDTFKTNTDILNFHFDLEPEGSNPIYKTLLTPAYDDVPSNQVWLQKDQQFRGYSKNSQIWS